MSNQTDKNSDNYATNPDYYYHFVDTQDADTDVGQSPLQPVNWAPGTMLLDHYRVERLLGTGGAARVYLVNNVHTSDQLAMKIPTINFSIGSVRQRLFYREIRTWMDLPVHPNLTTCHSFKTIKDRIAIFAEFVDGPSLDERVVQQNLLDVGQIIDIAIQVAWGLDVAHKSGVVHQDIKPSNIIVDVRGIAKITDFGLSKAHEQSGVQVLIRDTTNNPITNPSISRGVMTPSYCSVEQKNRCKLGDKTDMWSFALSVLTMFSGPTWWENGADGKAILKKYLASAPRQPYPMLPDNVRQVLDRCLEVNPDNRWSDINAVADQLIRCYLEETGSEYPRSRPHFRQRTRSRFQLQTQPITYRSPEGWLKRASNLDPSIKVHINLKDALVIKSRTTELLFHLEILEEAYRIYTLLFARGQKNLLEEIIQLTSTMAETHMAAENPSGALNSYNRAIDSLEAEIRMTGVDVYDPLLASVYSRKGNVLTIQGDYPEALRFHDKAILIGEKNLHSENHHRSIVQLVSYYLSKSITAGKAGDYRLSARIARTAANYCFKFRPSFREDDLQRTLANCFNNEANALQATGRLKSALTAYEQAQTAFNKVKNIDNTRSQTKLAILSMNRARVLIQLGHYVEAQIHLDRAIKILRDQVRRFGRKEQLRELAIAFQHQAVAFLQQGEPARAEGVIDRCIEIRDGYYHRSGMPLLAFDLGLAYCVKGRVRSAQTNYQDAITWFKKADALFEISMRSSQSPIFTHAKAKCYGHSAEAHIQVEEISTAHQLAFDALLKLTHIVHNQERTEYAGDAAWIETILAQTQLALNLPQKASRSIDHALPILKSELERTGREYLKKQVIRAQILQETILKYL